MLYPAQHACNSRGQRLGDASHPATPVANTVAAAETVNASGATGSQPPGGALAARFPVLPPPAALLEIAVLFGLIIGLGWLTGQDLADLRPHPFWVPVLLLSLQYGTVSGLLAAGIATACTGLGQLPEQVVGETYFVYFLRIWIEPILWISAAVLLGQFRMRQIANKLELARQVEELLAQRTSLADYAGKLRQRCETLERRLAGRIEPDALLMLQAISQLRRSGMPQVDAAFGHAMTAVLPGCQASLYLLDPEPPRAGTARLLRRSSVASADPDHGAITELNPAQALYQAIVQRAEGASVLTAAGEAILAGQGLLAVPVQSDDGVVIGMIKVEAMDAHLLGPGSLNAITAVAAALASPLQGAMRRHRTADAPAERRVPLDGAAAGQGTGQGIWRHVAKRLPAGLMGR
jgi:polysaccharide biosynthesis protein PelD